MPDISGILWSTHTFSSAVITLKNLLPSLLPPKPRPSSRIILYDLFKIYLTTNILFLLGGAVEAADIVDAGLRLLGWIPDVPDLKTPIGMISGLEPHPLSFDERTRIGPLHYGLGWILRENEMQSTAPYLLLCCIYHLEKEVPRLILKSCNEIIVRTIEHICKYLTFIRISIKLT